ncbi:hypothetical protein [Salinigranum halophilum]|uniref:hypothetical protein n=1 Tax=Salinigranum halophilum TaxID=2565931 RepID=UPI0010A8D96A|nr:hypothetical protein [Salinigranum halophilum]
MSDADTDSRSDEPDGRHNGTAADMSDTVDDRPESRAGAEQSPDPSHASSPGQVSTDSEDQWAPEARLRELEQENARLRSLYAQTQRQRYRRAALGLGVVGLVSLGAAALLPGVRTVLLILGGIGVFGALLTYYLTPETLVSAAVGERVYAALAENEAELVADLGLATESVYVPTGAPGGVRLFVPQYHEYTLPSVDTLSSLLVLPDDEFAQGISLRPSGQRLFDSFEETVAGGLESQPGPLAQQLTEAVVEVFELADGVNMSVDEEANQLTVTVSKSVYGTADHFDTPIVSFLAVGLAAGLERTVTADVAPGETATDLIVTFTWSASPPAPENPTDD